MYVQSLLFDNKPDFYFVSCTLNVYWFVSCSAGGATAIHETIGSPEETAHLEVLGPVSLPTTTAAKRSKFQSA